MYGRGTAVVVVRRLPTVLDFLDPGIVWRVPEQGPGSDSHQGLHEFLNSLGAGGQLPGLRLQVTLGAFACAGERVFVGWTVLAERNDHP
jgi:hypothetical protein